MGENHIELINPYLEQHNALIARIVSNVVCRYSTIFY